MDERDINVSGDEVIGQRTFVLRGLNMSCVHGSIDSTSSMQSNAIDNHPLWVKRLFNVMGQQIFKMKYE